MATISRPGVYIQETPLPQSVAQADTTNASGAFVGALAQGPVNAPVLVTTWGAFAKTFGGLDDLYPTTWAAYNFFANNGRQLYVKRVIGSGAAAGSITFTDDAMSPNNVFSLTTANPGAWASNYSAQVVPAGTSSRFGVNIYQTVVQNGVTSLVLVETYTDLSMDPTDANYFLSVINTRSNLVVAALLDGTKFPSTAASTPTAFSGGLDGASLVRADYAGAWTSFDSITNPLVIYAADAPYASTSTLTSQIHGDAVVYAASRTDSFVVIDTPAGLSVSAAQDQIAATAAIFAGANTGNIAAAYYPWYNIPDGTKTIGATRSQAPGAGVVGQYLATDAYRGPAKTPAGLNNKLALAVSTAHLFTNAELDSLNTGSEPINAIRQVPGAGIVIMGGRTLDNTPTNRYINIRRSLIYIEKQITDLSSFALFENNDSILWSSLRNAIGGFLLQYWKNGGLRGNSPDQAFFVHCDGNTTSFADIQAGRVNIEVGVALEYPAEFVVIKLGQLTGNASA